MILWKKSVGESREVCSRVMVLDRRIKARRPGDEMNGWKTKESSVGRRTELARRNM